MKTNQDPPADAAELRRRAEERLQTRERTPQSALDTERLVHELQVHQIELEMQNEELQQARGKADGLLAQYTDLYDFAPTGYFNLAVNLTGAGLLGIGRAQLLKRRLGFLVAEADRPVFNAFLEKTFAGKDRECCEVALLKAKTAPLFVRIEAVVFEDRRECRAAMLDVTDRHRAEVEQGRLVQELQAALAKVKQLSGLLPICANCKRIRNDEGYWKQIEAFIASHSEATFSHGICPECLHQLYPDQEQRILEGIERKERQNAAATP